MKKVALFFIVVAPIVALLAFGLTRNPNALPSTMIKKEAPTFDLPTLEGKRASLESFEGSPLVINFWASWCGPCLHEHYILNVAKKMYAETPVRFIGVVFQDSKENAEEYLKGYVNPFDIVLLDDAGHMSIDYGVGGVPETFFVDPKGRILDKSTGVLDIEYIRQKLDPMLEEK